MNNFFSKCPQIIFKIFAFILLLSFISHGQITFIDIYSKKASYKISIPPNYTIKEAIGLNVDLKFVNEQGFSIVSVVKNGPPGIKSSDINFMNDASDYEIKENLEASGARNIKILNKGVIDVNNHPSAFTYYTDGELYYHSITQFRKGKILNLTYTCTLQQRDITMPYIFRVINSLKWLDK
jgi:hypothetical protein